VIREEIFIIFRYLPNVKFSDNFKSLSMMNIKKYMMGLINSIDNIHKCGVIHRDIKPDNFLYNFETHEYMLIDFGLAEV
jgi:cell division control protein 7